MLALGDEALEAVQVEVVTLDEQDVAVRSGREEVVSNAQRLAQPRHAHAQSRGAGRGQRVAPQVVHQPISRDDLAGAEEQDGQQRPLTVTGQPQRRPFAPHLQRPQDAKVHAPS
jgi:hypothetical protein